MELKKIILTGPTGAVGVSLIEEMMRQNIHVTAICREHSAHLDAIPKSDLVDVVECNLDNLSGSQPIEWTVRMLRIPTGVLWCDQRAEDRGSIFIVHKEFDNLHLHFLFEVSHFILIFL